MASMPSPTRSARDGSPGTRVGGRYELADVIGVGGVAEVVRAAVVGAGDFRKPVVIKRLRAELRDDPELQAAFAREAQLAQRFQHANVVAVLDLGDDEGRPFIVMELVDGCSLQRLLEHRGRERVPVALALHVAQQIAAALQYVHGLRDDDGAPSQLVHRDVTPGNVLLSKDGAVKLTDFGIARTRAGGNDTLPGLIKGTPLYLSPEQAAGRPLDGRSDVYALGLVLRRMIAGDGPLDGHDAGLQRLVEHATEPALRDRCDIDGFVAALHPLVARLGDPRAHAELARLVRDAIGEHATVVRSLDVALQADRSPRTAAMAAMAAPALPSAWWFPLAALGIVALVVAIVWPRAPAPAELAAPIAAALDGADAPAARPPRLATPPAPAAPELPGSPAAGSTGVATAAPAAAPGPMRPAIAPRGRGRLKVNLMPYAEVSIDGHPRGQTPLDLPLRAGKHTVALYNPDSAQRRTLEIEIEPGGTASITAW